MNKREAVKKAIVMATIDSLLMEGSNTVYVWACHDHVDYVGPTHLGKDGYTQLDISNRAVRNFTYGKTALEFSTTYSGKGAQMVVPYSAISAVYDPTQSDMGFIMPDVLFSTVEKEVPEVPLNAKTPSWIDSAVVIQGGKI